MAPMFSIIVPVLDEAPILQGSLSRLQALAGDKEIIVVDGGSHDGSARIALELAQVIEAPRGRGRQMNAGAQVAHGRCLVFLHADCELAVDALEHVGRALGQPGVIAGCFRQHIAARGIAYRLLERCADWRASRLGVCYGDSGLFVTREGFAAAGGFPEVALFEDLGISRRLRRLGRIVLAPSVIQVSARRWEAHGIARTTLLNWALTLGFLLGVSEDRLSRIYRRPAVWPHQQRTLEPS